MPTGHLYTNKTWQQAMDVLRQEFQRWGVTDVHLPISKDQGYGRPVVVEYVPPGANTWQKIQCSTFPEPRVNLFAIALAIEATRKMDQRGMGAVLAQASAHLALPPSTTKVTRSPEEIVGIKPGMTAKQQVEQARVRTMETHPDKGGDPEEFKAVRAAAEKLGLV